MATDQSKWHRWLDLPNVDTFEGAMYNQFGIYRPTDNSLMRSLGRPFEEVNVEQMIVSAYVTVKPIDDATPAGTYDGNDSFFVTPVVPVNHTLDVQWFLDGNPINGATDPTFDASSLGLAPGTYTLEAVVTDNTAMVRDPALRAQWLSETRDWTLEVVAPEITLALDASATFIENNPPKILSPNADITAPGIVNFNNGTLTVDYASGGQPTDVLAIRNQGTGAGQIGASGGQVRYGGVLIGTYTGGAGADPLVISLRAGATVPRTEALLRNLVFRTSGNNPSTATRTVRMLLNDGAGGNSNAATELVHVIRRNDAPILNAATPAFNPIPEDYVTSGGKLVSSLVNGAMGDFDGPGRGLAVINAPTTSGRWQFTINGGTSWANIGVVTGDPARLLASNSQTRIRYIPNVNFNGQAFLRFRAWDQSQGNPGAKFTITATGGITAFSSGANTATITVNPVNDAPVLGGINGSVGYVRNDPAFVLAASATVADVDSANFATGELRVRITGTPSSANRLIIGGGFTVDANNKVLRGPTIIGTRNSDGVGTRALLVTFNANATNAIVQLLTRSIRFRTVGGEVGPRNVLFSVEDGDGGTSAVRTRVVNVT